MYVCISIIYLLVGGTYVPINLYDSLARLRQYRYQYCTRILFVRRIFGIT